MRLKHLSLTNYRNYTRLELELPARVNVFEGENAQGKTNLLEVIYYLATTKSPLASSDRELMSWDADREPIPFAQIDGTFVCGADEHVMAVTMVKESNANGNDGKLSLRRQILLDGVPRRAIDVVGQLKAVLFLPEDVGLVSGSPTGRRRYLDVTLCQIDPHYCRTLSRYNRVISQRNALLKRIRERQARSAELAYWDEQMAQHGAYVLARRIWAVGELGREGLHIQDALTSGREALTLQYDSRALEGISAPSQDTDAGEAVEALAGRLADALIQALADVRREEIARGITVIGPHRDDLRFCINGVDATVYGSRGQQRTIALALKLAELRLMQRHTGDQPVLLLDDVLSELDRQRSALLLEALTEAEQVLITTTGLSPFAAGPFSGDFLAAATLWRIVQGTISSISQPGPDPRREGLDSKPGQRQDDA